MLIEENLIGKVEVSKAFFVDLINVAVAESFGIVRTVGNFPQKLKTLITQKNNDGIIVMRENERLFIELHIEIKYGVNISEATKNLVERIKYTMENYIAIRVENVDVYIDKMSTLN